MHKCAKYQALINYNTLACTTKAQNQFYLGNGNSASYRKSELQSELPPAERRYYPRRVSGKSHMRVVVYGHARGEKCLLLISTDRPQAPIYLSP